MRKAVLALSIVLLAASACRSASTEPPAPSEADLSAGQATPGTGDLVEEILANARTFLEQDRLEDARMEVDRALALAPDHAEAQALRAEISMLAGELAGSDAVADSMAERYALRIQQIRADAEENLRRGQLALERGEYDNAIAEFTLALDHVRWSDYAIDWQGLDTQAQELLEQARAEREAAQAMQLEEAQREALAEIRAREAAEAERREAVVQQIIEDAIDAFDTRDYETALQLAESALQREPRNQQALEIRDASFRAGREAVREDYVRNRRERFLRWKEDMNELRIPWTGVITLPDEDYWNEISEIRAARPGLDLSSSVTEADAALRAELSSTTINGFVVSEEESLSAVVGQLRTLTGLPLVVDPLAEEAALDEGVVFEFDFQNPLTAERTLNLITEQAGEFVTWTIRHDAVLVTTREKARGKLIIYNHDVQDLIFGLTDFLGPRIDRLRLLDELEDDDGGGPFGGIQDKPRIIEPDDLATLVQENVAVGTWEDEGVSINVELGNMIVVQTPQVQMQVRQFLKDLRRFSSSLVTIESKFLTVADNWLQEFGVDFRGIDNNNASGGAFTDLDDVTNGLEDAAGAGLDNGGTGSDGTNAAGPPSSGFFYDDGEDGDFKGRTENVFGNSLGSALSTIGGFTGQWNFLNDLQFSMIVRMTEKSSQVELINDQVLSVHNTQRAYVTVINQRAYIQDFDVEVAQFESVADPQINVLTEGIVLDVRPTIHQNRKYLTLEIQPTVAQVVALRDFSTSLGSQTLPVSFQLPELEVQSVFTTAVVPDGGSILLGGLSRVRNVERRAEVPWLAEIPLVGFFFKEEGYNDENQSLMILIRAWITDVKEAIERLER